LPRLDYQTAPTCLLLHVRDLCLNAPSVAEYLAEEILNHLKDCPQPEVQSSKQPSKKKQRDGTGRSPKITAKNLPREEVQGQSATCSHTQQLAKLALHQLKPTRKSTTENPTRRQQSVVLDESTENSQTTPRPLLRSEAPHPKRIRVSSGPHSVEGWAFT
jgi:hypothetical protein